MTDENLVDLNDIAKYLNVNPMTVRRWVKAGRIKAYKLSGSHRGNLRFKLSEIKIQLGII